LNQPRGIEGAPAKETAMRIRNLLLIATLATSTVPFATSSFAGENEKTVKLNDIPKPARETILKEAKGAPILRVEEETAHGKRVYEGVVKKGDQEIGIVVNEKGVLVGKHNEKTENVQKKSESGQKK
jgi:hypothetical protein